MYDDSSTNNFVKYYWWDKSDKTKALILASLILIKAQDSVLFDIP